MDAYAYRILERLRKLFKSSRRRPSLTPFQGLILTILSQNTRDEYALKAFSNLRRVVPITAERLASTGESEIAEAIRSAGLYREKAKRIKEVSRVVSEVWGKLDAILKLPLPEARAKLLSLPGVGFKTADVLLLFYGGKPVIPVDTHVRRVSARLGLAPSRGGYEEVRRALEEAYRPEDYLDVHLLLISLGRSYCRARKPLCSSCPVTDLCPKIGVTV